MTRFPAEVVVAVLRHMNDDHRDDSLVIVRAFGAPDAMSAEMVDLDIDGGEWLVETAEGTRSLRVDWLSPARERRDLRHRVVELHGAASAGS